MHSSESHFKLLVWVGGWGAAVDTDKWRRQRAVLKLEDTHHQGRAGNVFASHVGVNVAYEHQGYVAFKGPAPLLSPVEHPEPSGPRTDPGTDPNLCFFATDSKYISHWNASNIWLLFSLLQSSVSPSLQTCTVIIKGGDVFFAHIPSSD